MLVGGRSGDFKHSCNLLDNGLWYGWKTGDAELIFSEALCLSFKEIFQPSPPCSDLSSFHLGKLRAEKELQRLQPAS